MMGKFGGQRKPSTLQRRPSANLKQQYSYTPSILMGRTPGCPADGALRGSVCSPYGRISNVSKVSDYSNLCRRADTERQLRNELKMKEQAEEFDAEASFDVNQYCVRQSAMMELSQIRETASRTPSRNEVRPGDASTGLRSYQSTDSNMAMEMQIPCITAEELDHSELELDQQKLVMSPPAAGLYSHREEADEEVEVVMEVEEEYNE